MIAAWSWVGFVFSEVFLCLHSHPNQSSEMVLGTADVVLVGTGYFFSLFLSLLQIRPKHHFIPAISKKRRLELHLIDIEAAKRLISPRRRRTPIIDKRGLIAKPEGTSTLCNGRRKRILGLSLSEWRDNYMRLVR